jgi:CRP-like cAMP-binding protein
MNTLASDQISQRQLHITETGIFSGLKEENLKELESRGVYMEYEQEIVTASGQQLEYLFFIIQGKFEVSNVEPKSGKKVVLATIGEGQCFGEMSFFTGSPASANVIAVGSVISWAIPHATLREFIEDHRGGALLAMNIGALMANRVQEGNSRLMGLSATLSAYFGHQARVSNKKKVNAPRTNQAAEMEIPDEIFDEFVKETLKLKSVEEITSEQREQVRAKIEADKIDIVAWLEKAERSDQLKMRLKLVKETGRIEGVRRPSSSLLQPTLLRIPQIRAQVGIPDFYPQPSIFGKILNIGSYVALPVLTALVIVLLLPLQTRVSWIDSQEFKSIPFNSMIEGFLVRSSIQQNPWTLQNGGVQSINMNLPKGIFLVGKLNLSQKSPSPLKVKVLILRKEGKQSVFNQVIDLPQNADGINLFSVPLSPGSYTLECTCEDWPADVKLPASIVVTARS